jgi:hypothetical protein
VSQEFLDAVEQAAQAHPALGAEPERLFQAFPADSLPDPRELRDAVQALQRTGERWLEVVKAHGQPRLEGAPSPKPIVRPTSSGPVHVHFFEPPARTGPPPSEPPVRTRPPPSEPPARAEPLPESPPAPLPLATRLRRTLAQKKPWIWLLCINGGAPIAWFALKWEVDWLFWVTGAVHFIGLLAAGSQRSREDLRYLAVLAFPAVFASFFAPSAWVSAQRLRDCPRAEGLSVRDAPEASEACWFRFRDGTVRWEFLGTVTVESKDSKGRRRWNTYHVYPVVPEGWTPEEPVTVWSTTQAPPGPLQGYGQGRSVPLMDAANASVARNGLLNHPRAVYVSWSPLPVDEDVVRREHEARLLWAVPNLLWLAAALVFWAVAFLRRSGAEAPQVR